MLKLLASLWNWISWNLTKLQLIQLIRTIVIFNFSISCLIELKFGEALWFFFSNRCWKFQLSILKNKTAIVIIKTKSFVYWPNFQWRFWCRCASHFFDQHSGCNIGCCSTGTTVKTTATTNSKPFDHYFEIQLIFCHLIAQKRVWVWNLNF